MERIDRDVEILKAGIILVVKDTTFCVYGSVNVWSGIHISDTTAQVTIPINSE